MESRVSKIIYAVTKGQFRGLKGTSVPAVDAICTRLDLFSAETAERSHQVFILKGHPKTEACEKHYRAAGADVTLFDDPTAPPPEPPKEEAKPEAPKEEAPKEVRQQKR